MSDDSKNIKNFAKWAEVYRLGHSSGDPINIKVTRYNLPKEGDKVRCVPGFRAESGSEGTDSGGAGYILDKILTVRRVSNQEDRPIVWFTNSDNGVYYDALEYV